jgi:hypothetical protein
MGLGGQDGGMRWVGAALQISILMGSVGLMQSRVLAGRFFQRKKWFFYALAGAVLCTLAVGPFWEMFVGNVQVGLQQTVNRGLNHGLDQITGPWISLWPLTQLLMAMIGTVQMLVFGAITALFQSAALPRTPGVRSRWMMACALGYYFGTVARQLVLQNLMASNVSFVLQIALSSLVAGSVLGLITCGVLERILFTNNPEVFENT